MTNTAEQFIAPEQGQKKKTNPLWYRSTDSYLFGVNSAPQNLALGIENIDLKPASANQAQYGILENGSLRTILGTFTFQIRRSEAGYPYISTISTGFGQKNEEGKHTQFWEHIMLNAKVKAQILRFFEAYKSGQMQQAPAMPWMNQYQQPMNQYQQPQGQYQQPQAPMNYVQPAPAYTPPATQPTSLDANSTEITSDDLPF